MTSVGPLRSRPLLSRHSAIRPDWINAETCELCLGPGETPSARPRQHYSELWWQSEIWVWDAVKHMIKYPPGSLD